MPAPPLAPDDTEVMMTAEKLGLARFAREDNGATLVVEGTGGEFARRCREVRGFGGLYMGNAGTATRFIQSVLTRREVRSSCPDSRGISIALRTLADSGPLSKR